MNIHNKAGSIIANARMMRVARSRARAITSRNPSPKLNSYSGINGGNSGNSSSLGTGNAIKNTQKKSNYNTIINAAESLQTHAKKMSEMKAPEDTADDAAKAKYKNDMVSGITQFAEAYNTMIGRLNKTGNAVDSSFAKQLKNYVTTNKASLKELGIEVTGTGALNIDEKALKAADVDKMKKLFGTKDGFAPHIAELSETAKKRAKTNLEEIERKEFLSSFGYNKNGMNYNNYGNNTSYDWRS